MSQTPTTVGIDLGTTFSLAAIVENGRPRVLPNALGEVLTPSAVSVLPNGELLVGRAAKVRATLHPEATALTFKRDMGTSRTRELAGRQFRPEELSAAVLRTLKEDAEKHLGRPIDEAVISVPAYFDEAQRQATKVAAELIGLKVERLINEPTAAALAYGIEQREREHRAVVLDLGGGTFDVTVLEIMEGVIEIRATAGDVQLGGEDFTTILARWAAAEVERETGVDPTAQPIPWARLLEAAEATKHTLSERAAARLVIPQLDLGGAPIDFEREISREETEVLWAELLARLELPIRRAVRDAGLALGDLDEVLLVGGATRMPSFVRLAATLFGRMPLRSLPPDEAVALGAALQAGLKDDDRALDDLVVTDIAPFTLGVSTVQDYGRTRVDGLFSPLLERGTVIPASRSGMYSTAQDGQTEIHIEVYQGEHPLVRDNRFLGELRIAGLPRGPAGAQGVEVRFTYDLNGLLEVEARVLSTGVVHSIVLEQAPGRLTPAEIAAARERMAALKFHPRDALPNTALIGRAEALFVELVGPRRDVLGQALAHFRGALESQDAEGIRQERAYLQGLVDQHSGEPRG